MRIGTRIVRPDDVKRWDAEIYQISMYRGWIDDIGLVKQCVRSCIEKSVSYVMHPVGFPLLDHDSFGMLKVIAEVGAEKMILHDERSRDGERITGINVDRFGEAVSELASFVPLSFENATDTHDALWFWEHFADSITLDIGHIEAAGMNSVEYIQHLDQEVIKRIEYVHIHHNGEFRNGLTDHHPLHGGCRELEALDTLLRRNHDVAVILEINETDMIDDSLGLLRDLRERITES
jgi:sugar phosphate isomerase/epimerase